MRINYRIKNQHNNFHFFQVLFTGGVRMKNKNLQISHMSDLFQGRSRC